MKRTSGLFWGVVLLLAGGLLLAYSASLLTDFWGWFWPLATIWAGLWLLWQPLPLEFVTIETGRDRLALQHTREVPLNSAQSGRLTLEQGIGSLTVRSGAPEGAAALLDFNGIGNESHWHHNESQIHIHLESGISMGKSAQVLLNPGIPWRIEAESGVGSLNLDLHDLQAPEISIEGGICNLVLNCPASGNSQVDIETGIGNAEVRLAATTAVTITSEGTRRLEISEDVFHREETASGKRRFTYLPDGETTGQVHLQLEHGLGTIRIVQG